MFKRLVTLNIITNKFLSHYKQLSWSVSVIPLLCVPPSHLAFPLPAMTAGYRVQLPFGFLLDQWLIIRHLYFESGINSSEYAINW